MARPRSVRLSRTAEKALEDLEQRSLDRLKASVRELVDNPLLGKKLKGDFEGLRSYRLGTYRIVYRFTRESVEIVSIDHRKDVYR
jgi:mRNA-degrading endonuclease RelE of RelBE toxin-antitoxin system